MQPKQNPRSEKRYRAYYGVQKKCQQQLKVVLKICSHHSTTAAITLKLTHTPV